MMFLGVMEQAMSILTAEEGGSNTSLMLHQPWSWSDLFEAVTQTILTTIV
jgi:hypothetical protein